MEVVDIMSGVLVSAGGKGGLQPRCARRAAGRKWSCRRGGGPPARGAGPASLDPPPDTLLRGHRPARSRGSTGTTPRAREGLQRRGHRPARPAPGSETGATQRGRGKPPARQRQPAGGGREDDKGRGAKPGDSRSEMAPRCEGGVRRLPKAVPPGGSDPGRDAQRAGVTAP
jgi:hypothetical protein